MKFTSKILAVAVASLAVAGAAHAGGSSPNSGNGSVLLYVWDNSGGADGGTANQAYILNTGLTYTSLLADIASNTPVTLNSGGSSLFESLFTPAEIAGGNVQFSIITGNNDTANPVAITGGPVPPSWLPGGTEVGQLLSYEDASTTNVGSTAETSLTALVPGNGNYQLYSNQVSTQNNNTEAAVLASAGTTDELYQSVSQPNTGSPRAPVTHTPIVTDTGDSFTLLADGQVNISGAVSAVPLPAAVWLFGSGLLGLFGVGRRRKNA